MTSPVLRIIASLGFGYAAGMIPFAYLIGRLKGVDIRTTGSGNIGATNLGRNLGLPYFLAGFVLDALKGLGPVLAAPLLQLIPGGVGAGAILGHIFNPLFGFRGGKGVSTTIGVALGLVPLSFVAGIGVWVIIYLTTFWVSLASIGFALVIAVATWFVPGIEPGVRIFIAVLAALVIAAHHSNIKRILTGTERRTVLWNKRQ